jgi:hypothetical protein
MEHHMNSLDFDFVTIDQYNLGAVYCRNSLGTGGVCIFVQNSLNYSNINLDSFCIDQIIEICAVKLLTAKQLNTLTLFFNLFSIIGFRTRSQNNSISLIDNIFVDNSQSGKYLVYPMNNGLSDHEEQLLIIKTICLQVCKYKISTRRMFSNQSLLNFKMQLSFETWDDVFSGNNVDIIFNCFLNTYLRIFNSSFPLKKITISNLKTNNWITQGIIISC